MCFCSVSSYPVINFSSSVGRAVPRLGGMGQPPQALCFGGPLRWSPDPATHVFWEAAAHVLPVPAPILKVGAPKSQETRQQPPASYLVPAPSWEVGSSLLHPAWEPSGSHPCPASWLAATCAPAQSWMAATCLWGPSLVAASFAPGSTPS